ncbi:hypothetical protein C0J52_05482 [Blattella germanica]|nr:hypothetical protein C0J52_05482 [Blattella germanica]
MSVSTGVSTQVTLYIAIENIPGDSGQMTSQASASNPAIRKYSNRTFAPKREGAPCIQCTFFDVQPRYVLRQLRENHSDDQVEDMAQIFTANRS